MIYFKAGIDSGYMVKPCLDPYDPECPKTAPNYKTKKVFFLLSLFRGPTNLLSNMHLCLKNIVNN